MQRPIKISNNRSKFCIKHPQQITIIQTGFIPTSHLTPRTRALLEQTTVSRLIMKSQAFHEIRIFITVSTTAHHYSLRSVKFFQSETFEPISLRSSWILLSHIRLGHRSNPFSSSSATNTLCTFYSPQTCHSNRLSQPPWFHHLSNICCGLQNSKFLITQFSLLSSYFHLGPVSFLFSKSPNQRSSLNARRSARHIHIRRKAHVKLCFAYFMFVFK